LAGFFASGRWRFALAWLMPIGVALCAWQSPWAAWGFALALQITLAAVERLPGAQRSPPAEPPHAWHRGVLWMHALLQAGLLGLGLWLASGLGVHGALAWPAVVALGIGVGSVTGSQGITYAHELGHGKRRADRALGWFLMGSVLYAHFMVEHYRGHHPRAATHDDPASARRGESLWRFLPRTLGGSLVSAWRLEAQFLAQRRRGWWRSALLWVTLAQAGWLALLWLWLGGHALLFWAVQAAYAVFLLESINYIEHYGLQRRVDGVRREPFGMQHAWNADHWLTNSFIANLQRHSDHHMHAWKPYPELQPLPGPQLPTGYAGCIFAASVPPLWFRLMEPRLQALARAA
jgi:alkane 1-monooxygenase